MNEMHQRIGEYLKPHMKKMEPALVEITSYLQHQEEEFAKSQKKVQQKTKVAVPIGQRINQPMPKPPKKPPPPYLLKNIDKEGQEAKYHWQRKQRKVSQGLPAQSSTSSRSSLPKMVPKQSCIGKGSKGKSAKGLQLNPAPPVINPNCIPLSS